MQQERRRAERTVLNGGEGCEGSRLRFVDLEKV